MKKEGLKRDADLYEDQTFHQFNMGFFKSDMSSFFVPVTTMLILSKTDLFVWGIGVQNYSFKDIFTLDCGEVAIPFLISV